MIKKKMLVTIVAYMSLTGFVLYKQMNVSAKGKDNDDIVVVKEQKDLEEKSSEYIIKSVEVIKNPETNQIEYQAKYEDDIENNHAIVTDVENEIQDHNEQLNLGTAGRLYMGNWSVALNYVSGYDGAEQQRITDAWDSAAYIVFDAEGITCIADHNTQGFEIMKWYGPGSYAKIVDSYGIKHDIYCVSYYGDAVWYNGVTTLQDGRRLWEIYDAPLIMKTCNDNPHSNTISCWQYLN